MKAYYYSFFIIDHVTIAVFVTCCELRILPFQSPLYSYPELKLCSIMFLTIYFVEQIFYNVLNVLLGAVPEIVLMGEGSLLFPK